MNDLRTHCFCHEKEELCLILSLAELNVIKVVFSLRGFSCVELLTFMDLYIYKKYSFLPLDESLFIYRGW
jgi:hypothetical protein